jgi:Carboxypeptidase regulatory-like domain
MPLRVSHVLKTRRNRFVVISVLAAIAFFAASAGSAWAMTPLTGEGLTGAGKSTGGSASGGCPNRTSESGSMRFNLSGTAVGPYPGSLSEMGSFSLSGYRNPPWTIRFSAAFTITSGKTTITGSFASPSHAWWGVGFICNSAGGVAGYSVSGPVTYTATINGQTFQGTGSVSATLYAQSGAKDSVSESVTVSYGQIAGAAMDSATSAPIAGICVKAYNSSGGVLASAQTNSSGAYTLSSVAAGSAQVGFSSGCGASNYLTQYYNGKSSLASADPVGVTAGATTSGINAAMAVGGQITGTVTDSATKAALAGICVQADDNSGGEAASTQTNSSGVYTLSALPTGSYHVGFADCAAGPDNAGTYVTQYYNGKATLASADPIAVTAGTTTSGINAAMVTHGQITGTVTDSATGAPLAGICLDVFDSGGGITAQSSTNANGVYTTIPLPSGSYRVGFDLGCGDSTYAAQYYNGRATLAGADPVTVTDGTTTSGINAALVAVNGSAPPSSVATGSASGVGTGSATLSGTVNPNGTATTYHFDYGTSTNYGSQAPASPDPNAGAGTTAQTESTTLTGLSPNTLYHYRIEATNGLGTSYGAGQTFTTTGAGTSPASPAPIVATGSALNVGTFGPGSATVSGTVNANGETATYHFDYGTSTNYTSRTISEPISSTTAEFVDAGLTGLSPNTVYHYRIEATDAWGTSYGADQTFTNAG